MAADLLTRVRAEIDARMAVLRPAIAEHQRLLAAAEALELDLTSAAAGVSAGRAPASAAKPTRRAVARPTRQAAAAKPARRAAPRPARGAAARPARGAVARPARRAAAKPAAAQQAIVAALEHGSHTVAELGVVTAMPGAEIRDGLRHLQRAGRITRSSREGRIAYVLSGRA